MFTGVYKFYIDGEYVGEQENSITRAGRAIILKSIMGLLPTVGGEIHIGIDSTANGVPDLDGLIPNNILGFDIAASPVKMSYLDNSGSYDAMVFKASFGSTATPGEKYKIRELGLFPGTGSSNSVSTFKETTLFSGSVTDAWKNGSTDLVANTGSSVPTDSCYITSALTSYEFRVGDTALFLDGGETISVQKNFNSFNFNFYNNVDKLAIAYSKLTGASPTINIKFYSTVDDYFVATFAITGSQTYGIAEVTVQDINNNSSNVGNPTWSNIIKIEMSSSQDIVIDAVRFNNVDDVDTVYGMVSRAVLDTPIVKESNSVLDIEYYLSMGFNKTVV